MTTELLFDLLLVVLGVLVLASLGVKHRLYQRLEHDHRDLWVELGSPVLVGHRSWREAFSGPAVIWSNRLAELSDPTASRLVAVARGVDLAGYIVFAVLAVLFLLAL